MYSWINEALAEAGGEGERFSELIPDTVGGRTRAQIEQYQRQQQNQQAQLHNTSGRSSSNGDAFSAFARRLQQHSQPGDGAQRLYKMVQQPFTVKFGNSEVEQQRAGSSARPPLTPFFKDAHPFICNDSPRPKPITQSAGTQTTPPVASSSPRHFHPSPMASSSPYSSTTTVRRCAQSLADFPPLYNFSQRPLTHIRHSSLGANSGTDPNFYRKRFIDSLLKDIRRSKELERKLEGRREELDEACRRDAHELGTIRRERELLVRELEMQSREYELEERSRHSSSSLTRQSSPPPPPPAPPKQPILKQQTNGNGSRNNRVNFASPICTSLKSTTSSR
ncbi:hypothetical protein niasHT_016396 [Heterodera trifolii]|uniref:Uncharacterized protein n=1 Tax=Heterodera trifolii TaxID=157864 RepID=A0ABD2LKB8_9BILA